jgi:hypothetical protein
MFDNKPLLFWGLKLVYALGKSIAAGDPTTAKDLFWGKIMLDKELCHA